MEFYSGFEMEPKKKRAKKVATETTEAPSQDKRMYSEEEVIDLLIEMNSWPTIFEGKEDITEWLNQSKNK